MGWTTALLWIIAALLIVAGALATHLGRNANRPYDGGVIVDDPVTGAEVLEQDNAKPWEKRAATWGPWIAAAGGIVALLLAWPW